MTRTGVMARAVQLILPMLLLAAAAGAQADAFKCRAADGRVVISSTPCQEGNKTLAIQADDRVTPEQRLLAEKEVERQRKTLAEREALRGAEEKQESDARQKLAAEESSRRTQCIQNAQQEPDPQFRADLIAACNGVAPQRPAAVQQPVLIPVVPVRKIQRPAAEPPVPHPQRPQASQAKSDCRQVSGGVRCY